MAKHSQQQALEADQVAREFSATAKIHYHRSSAKDNTTFWLVILGIIGLPPKKSTVCFALSLPDAMLTRRRLFWWQAKKKSFYRTLTLMLVKI
jgi:hypothetical protein